MTEARRLLRLFAVAGAIISAGVLMLAAPALAQTGVVPGASEIPGGTTPLIVLGTGLASTLAALVYMVRQIANGKLVPSHTAEREDKLVAVIADGSADKSKLIDMVQTERERSDSYRRLLEQYGGGAR